MLDQCLPCEEIILLEKKIDMEAECLSARINQLVKDVRLRNNQRWEEFASLCNFPVIGSFFHYYVRSPSLEKEPSYLHTDWYQNNNRLIIQKATRLEQMKGEHIEHWSEELLHVLTPGDEGGLMTPQRLLTRKECYDPKLCADFKRPYLGEFTNNGEHFIPLPPKKWEFYETEIVQKDERVMDYRTKRIVPRSECQMILSSRFKADKILDKIIFSIFGRANLTFHCEDIDINSGCFFE